MAARVWTVEYTPCGQGPQAAQVLAVCQSLAVAQQYITANCAIDAAANLSQDPAARAQHRACYKIWVWPVLTHGDGPPRSTLESGPGPSYSP